MEDIFKRIDELLEKSCYVIDILPERVPDLNNHYLDVEYYLLNSEKRHEMKDRYVSIILKLMCYYRAAILWNGWNDDPKPGDIDAAVSGIMENHSGTLNVLFPNEDALLVFEWDFLHLSIYNMPEHMKALAEKIALSEDFFCWT